MPGRIAVLEDDVDSCEILRLLFDPDYQVDAFRETEPLKTALRETHYDAMLVDLLIEGQLAGISILQHVRRQPKIADMPVVLVTGDNVRFTSESARRIGFDGYIVKPFEFDDLARTVKALIARYSLRLRASA
jgi:two-component system OmpR family response regulator/two-component system alkaline phosphatase synthesis response regulator PhoP